MRITFICPFPNLSGGNRVIADYAEGLARKGHNVTIVAERKNRSPRNQIQKMLRKTRNLGKQSASNIQVQSHYAERNINIIMAPTAGPVTADITPDADIIIATWWETAYWIRDFPPQKGKKFYFMQDYGAVNQPLENLIETWLFGYNIITISNWLESFVQRFAPQPIAVVSNGVDSNLFNIRERTKPKIPTIGYVHSPLPTKGAVFAGNAIAQAIETIPSLQVQVLGDPGPAMLDVLPRTTTVNHQIPDQLLPTIYGACTAWLFTSLNEGYGLPILEAMGCGTPVIGFSSAAAPELLAEGGGALVTTGDTTELATQIQRFCTMPNNEWMTFSQCAYDTVYPNKTLEVAINQFEQALLNFSNRPVSQPL